MTAYFIRSLLLVFTIFFTLRCPIQAQNPVDTAEYFPSQRIDGGAPSFYAALSQNLSYVWQAREDKIMGTCIIAITLSPDGKMEDLEFVTTLHRSLNQDIRQVIRAMNKLWLPAKNLEKAHSLKFFVPINYILNGFSFNQSFEKPTFLATPILITTADPSVTNFEEDATLAEQANHLYIEEKDYKKVMDPLNELIRRNPYNKNIFIMRGLANYQLGKKEEACKDFKTVSDFLKQDIPPAAKNICQ